MKIRSVTVSNYKGIRDIEFTPDADGHLIVIAGKNGQGKTSFIDAIWAALSGGEVSRQTALPIRDGETKASVRIDLGEYIVTRSWKKNDVGTLTVETPRGAKYSKGQTVLNELIGKLSMDPMMFARMTGPQQVATLLDVIGDSLPFKPAELEQRRKSAYENRTAANKIAAQFKARVEAAPSFEGVPDEEVNMAHVVSDYRVASERNEAIAAARRKVEARAESVARATEQSPGPKRTWSPRCRLTPMSSMSRRSSASRST